MTTADIALHSLFAINIVVTYPNFALSIEWILFGMSFLDKYYTTLIYKKI